MNTTHTVLHQKTARILAQIITYVAPIVILFISLVITVPVTFTRQKSVQFWILTKRVAHVIVVTGPMVLSYIAIVINLIVDNLFGSGSDSDADEIIPPTNSTDQKNRTHPK